MIGQCPLSVVCWRQQFALKAYSSYTPGPTDSKLGGDHLENLFFPSSPEPKCHHIIIGFLINVQVQGQHSHQWAPFQIAVLLHAWQISHQISRYAYHEVDSQELPLCAIPLCQLLPCHLWPPKPTLSLNLYVKGCLDCTIGAFHMSIPAEPSLLQNEVQILNAKSRK